MQLRSVRRYLRRYCIPVIKCVRQLVRLPLTAIDRAVYYFRCIASVITCDVDVLVR